MADASGGAEGTEEGVAPLRRRWIWWWAAVAAAVTGLLPGPAPAADVYFSDYGTNTIQRVKDDGTSLTTVLGGLNGVRGVQIDQANGKLYWSEAGSHTVRRSNLDGSAIEDLVVMSSGVPYEIALDTTAAKLYWTDEAAATIRRANLDGSSVEALITSGMSRPVGIALDLTAGKMYWADYDLGTIDRADLDGTARETLLIGLSCPNHVALDASAGHLYFTHGLFTPSSISRANLDGSGRVTVVSGEASAAGLTLDRTTGMMFWTAEDGFALRRATLSGDSVTTVVGGLSRPLGVAVAAAPLGPPPPAGLVSWWRGEGDTADSVGFNHGVASGGVSYVAGVSGQAFSFDGVDGSVNVPSSPSLDVGGQVTIALWMRDDDLTPGRFDGVGLVTTDHWGVVQAVPVSTEMYAFLDRYAETNESNDWNALPPGPWYHVAATYDGAAMQMYVNGRAWGPPSLAGGPLPAMVGSLSIGSEEGRVICPSCMFTRYFQGAIDEVMIFNRALAATEVAELASALENQAPLASAASVTSAEYRPFDGVLTGSDPEHASLSFAVVSPARNGAVTISNAVTGAFTYIPTPGFTGTDSFAFVVSDGERASAPAVVTISVEPADPEVTVRLVDSWGGGLAGAGVSYYKAGWQPFGTTGPDGAARLVLPARSYPIRISYGGASVQRTHDVGADPLVVFSTTEVVVRLVDSGGAPLDPGAVEYYASGWKPLGTTAGGEARAQLLPVSYPFAIGYEGGRNQKTQDVGADPVVTFQTRQVTVRLLDSDLAPLDTGEVQYYASGWKPFGSTAGGEVRKELLPASYPFAVTFAGGRNQKPQDVAADPTVTFQTRPVTVRLLDAGGSPLDTGEVQYYASGWKPFGSTAGGEVRRELLPGTYPFAVTFAGGRNQKSQDVAADPTVVFQAGAVISDSGTCTQYYASGWKAFAQGMHLLPATYPFRFSGGTPSQQSHAIAAGVENHIR